MEKTKMEYLPCPGCEQCKNKRVPKFKNEDEERKFWENHSSLDFPEDFKDVEIDIIDLRPKKAPISLRIERELLRRVKIIALRKKTGYQTLIKIWISEKVREIEKELIAKKQAKKDKSKKDKVLK